MSSPRKSHNGLKKQRSQGKTDGKSMKNATRTNSQSIMDMFKRQRKKDSPTKHLYEKDEDVIIVESEQSEEQSPYFSPKKDQKKKLSVDTSNRPMRYVSTKSLATRLSLSKQSWSEVSTEHAENHKKDKLDPENEASPAKQPISVQSDLSNSKDSKDVAHHIENTDMKNFDVSSTPKSSDTSMNVKETRSRLSLKKKRKSSETSFNPDFKKSKTDGEDSPTSEKRASNAFNVLLRSPQKPSGGNMKEGKKSAVKKISSTQEALNGEENSAIPKADTSYADSSNRKNEDTVSHSEKVYRESETEQVKLETNAKENVKDDEEEENEGGKEEGENGEYRIPYYLENFQLVLETVLGDEFYQPLFNKNDLCIVEKFNTLSENAQKVYIRMFGRQYRWLRSGKIVYPRIAPDLSEYLQELVSTGLVSDESKLEDLEDVLRVLPAPDLRTLAKSLRLNTINQQMSDIIQAVLKHSKKTHIGAFFKQAQGGTAGMIVKRAKSMVGKCFLLEKEARAVFIRVMMLFSLHQINGDEDEQGGGQQQLFQILMSNIGRIVYPKYTVNKQTRIFLERDDLLRFESAVQVESDIREALERNDLTSAMQIYETTKPTIEQQRKNPKIKKHDVSLPPHLRVFTAGAAYARFLGQAVEVLQKLRKYDEAVTLLEDLITQDIYHLSYRGRWYERLALNLDQHLKKHSKSLDVIKKALSDPNVKTGHRYSLFQRAHRLCHSTSSKLKSLQKRWPEFQDDPMAAVQDPIKLVIEGRQMPRDLPGMPAVWISEETASTEEATLITRVEDFVLSYYRSHDFPQGLHGEGGTLAFLFGLYFWDIIFMDGIADTFLNPYQCLPLDFHTDNFYNSRKTEIEERLAKISNSSVEELTSTLEESWNEHENVLCAGVSWERFDSLQHAQGLVRCMGGPVLSGILSRMARSMRQTRGGVPDLIVWNTETLKFKVVEVKGPGDRLSTKQILWLDYLCSLGVDAIVCHVQAIGAKKLR